MISRRHECVAGALALAGSTPRFAIRARRSPEQFRISTAAPPSRTGSPRRWSNSRRMSRARLPGQIAVSVHANSSLFRQGTEVPAIQRGNLEMSTMTTFEIEQQMPEFGVFSTRATCSATTITCAKVMDGPIGERISPQHVADKMGIDHSGDSSISARASSICARREASRRRPISRASSCACRRARTGCCSARRSASRRRRWRCRRSISR